MEGIPAGLLPDIWQHEILAKYLSAQHWPRTRHALALTCRWFARRLDVSWAASKAGLAAETEALRLGAREWWPALAWGLQLTPGDESAWYSDAMCACLRSGPGQLLAYWNMSAAVPSSFYTTRGVHFFWEAAGDGGVVVARFLWEHSLVNKANYTALSALLTTAMKKKDWPLYEWLLSLGDQAWYERVQGATPFSSLCLFSKVEREWEAFVQTEPDRRWLRGYLKIAVDRINPRTNRAKASKKYWDRLRALLDS